MGEKRKFKTRRERVSCPISTRGTLRAKKEDGKKILLLGYGSSEQDNTVENVMVNVDDG